MAAGSGAGCACWAAALAWAATLAATSGLEPAAAPEATLAAAEAPTPRRRSTSGVERRWVVGTGMAAGTAAAPTTGAFITGIGVDSPEAATGSGAEPGST